MCMREQERSQKHPLSAAQLKEQSERVRAIANAATAEEKGLLEEEFGKWVAEDKPVTDYKHRFSDESLFEKVEDLLRQSAALDDASIPESRKKISIWALEGSPVRVKNMISNIFGAENIWDLVHVTSAQVRRAHYFPNSRCGMLQLVAAIDEALKMLSNSGAVGAK